MDDPDVTTVAQGVTRMQCCWGFVLEGQKEALIASGLALDEWFIKPGLLNKRGQVRRSKRLVVDGREIQTTLPAKGPATVQVRFTEAECNAHEESEKNKQGHQSASGRDPNLANLTSADDYRHALQRFVPTLISNPNCLKEFDGVKSNDGYVYGITPESRERIEDAIRDMYFALRDVDVYRRKYDARTDAEKEAACQAVTAAEMDQSFQRFLKLSIGQASAAD